MRLAPRTSHHRALIGALAGAVALATACGEGARSAPGGGGGPGGGGRGTPTVVLSPADVHTVARERLETTTPLSGDLRPIEEISIRARVDGDLLAVLVRDGDAVRAGAPLARLDTTELAASLAAARADLAAAEGEAATADWNFVQARELFDAGAIAEQALRAAEQGALAARARAAAAEARLRSAELAWRDAVVTAPATGTIARRLVQTGERVARGTELFRLVRDDTLEFTALVPARAAGMVRTGQDVRFSADGRAFVGRVARVSPAVDPASRSVAVYVQVANRDRSLKANTFAAGRVVAETHDNVLAIPLTAVRQSQQESATFVYRIDGEDVAVVPVRLGVRDEARGMVEVLDGLAERDRVVVGNVGTIGRGMRVQIVDADRPPGS